MEDRWRELFAAAMRIIWLDCVGTGMVKDRFAQNEIRSRIAFLMTDLCWSLGIEVGDIVFYNEIFPVAFLSSRHLSLYLFMPLVLCFINAFYIWAVCCSFMWFDNCQYPSWNILLLVLLMAISPGFSYYCYIMKVSAVPWHVCLVSFHPLLLITGWCCVPPKCFSNLFLLFFGTCHSVFVLPLH